MNEEDIVMDDSKDRSIANILRSPLSSVVEALRIGDYSAGSNIPMVDMVDDSTARQIKEYIEDYGETLVALPEEAWATSRSRWMGTYWDVLIDLWTQESGRSDLAMSARIFRDGDAYRIRIMNVHVP